MNRIPVIRHRRLDIDGTKIFYRETVPSDPDAPVLLLLHGFPSGSHQYRRLMDALGPEVKAIAPDYPGFGFSDAPTSTTAGGAFEYSFAHLAKLMIEFVQRLGLTRFALYLFDFGAPIGLRLAQAMQDRVSGLIVQNGNLYHEGLTPAARDFIALRLDEEGALAKVDGLLSLEVTRSQYEGGTTDVEKIAPDGWTLDQHFLDLPERLQPQRDLAFDYKSNLALYPEWQAWLRERQPPVLITWGRNDPFFAVPGAEALRRDVPDAELHLFDTGHFALEENLPEIAPLVAEFLGRLDR